MRSPATHRPPPHGGLMRDDGAASRPTSRKGHRMPLNSRQHKRPVAPLAHGTDAWALPADRIPDKGLGSEAAYEQISSELLLDGQARLNLATFVTTWMPSTAARLMAETADKNMIDKDEYPQTAEIEARCVRMLADLWSSPEHEHATGCSTTGSSEAAMLAGLALKWRWRARAREAGRATDKPNLVMGVNVQVCWEKFCRYWDVEPRMVPMEGERFHLGAEEAVARCDENTIGVVAILGSTFDGSYEPVKDIAAALDQLERDRGLDIPMHVDGASGGFVAPFLQPELEWDFRLPRVQSINASGHKYGLVYPGVGWAVWRDEQALPEELVFHVDYLGGDMPTFALNFSRPAGQVAAQYYMFLRLGHDGYRQVQQASRDTAKWLAEQIAGMEPFELVAPDAGGIPAFAFCVAGDAGFSVYDVSEALRVHGWIVPAYPMPPAIDDLHVLRIVVRNGFGRPLAAKLLDDLGRSVKRLEKAGGMPPSPQRVGFHH